MKAILVHNPVASGGRTRREDLLSALRRAGITVLYQSSKVGELTAVLAESADLIIVAGGDGTVAKVLTQMPDRAVPVAILPVGTANNIANSFGIEGPPAGILASLNTAGRRRLHIGLVRGPWGRCRFVEGVGLGALVKAADRVGRSQRGERRLEAARREIRRILKSLEPDRVHVTLDGVPLPAEHLMLEVLNIARSGPRLLMSPTMDPGDGQLEVVMLEPGQRQAMRRWLKQAPESAAAPVRRWRGRRVSIAWQGSPLHVDDDLPRADTAPGTVEVELTETPITLLVPQL
jgi:diacylglycerol kinase (ATP)